LTLVDIKKLFQSRHGIYGENGFDIEFSVCVIHTYIQKRNCTYFMQYIERKTEKDLYFGDYKSAIQPCNHPKKQIL